MSFRYRSPALLVIALQVCFSASQPSLPAAELPASRPSLESPVAPASDEGAQAMKRYRIPQDWNVELIAAEPDLANPVAFAFDEQERIYVVETFRHGNGVLDIRGRAGWPSPGFKKDLSPERRANLADEILDADVACRTVEDRERMLRMYFAENAPSLEAASDRVKMLLRGSDGRVSGSTVFADGFNSLVDGLASGVLARGNEVWFTDIPHLWRFRDVDNDGVAETREKLLDGFGVRVGFLGHDLHGLRFGPDGRLYFTIGDRGANVVTREGKRIEVPETGAVFRCEPDGSNLEVFASGLRNPQELVFDAFGNLWTGDNNSDGGDQARWTYLVQGGDSGWRIGWQYLESPQRRGPWNSERMWVPEEAAKIGYLVPPLANIGAGPSGITYAAGSGLPEAMNGHFFMVDFRGGPSGIWEIAVQPKGAGYEVSRSTELIWNALPTDVELGPDGGLYWTDWVQGWSKTGKGRIYRLFEPESVSSPLVAETRQILRQSLNGVESEELVSWLRHPDLRVRLRAQFALADLGDVEQLSAVAHQGTNLFARLHGIWGVGQLARKNQTLGSRLVDLLQDTEPEVRAQAARTLGDAAYAGAGPALEKLLGDPQPRPRFFAAIALGHLQRREAGPGVIELLRNNNETDPFLRHAGVMGLVGTRSAAELATLAHDKSRAVRLAAVVALRRLKSPQLADFLNDQEPAIVLEAARAIHDLPVAEALPRLGSLIHREDLPEPLLRRVLNANLRLGGETNAALLASLAVRKSAPEWARSEALRALGQFPEPPGRDLVTGLWRPLAARTSEPSRAALKKHFATLLQAPDSVAIEAMVAATRLRMSELTPEARRVASNTNIASAVRVAALRAVVELGDPESAKWVTALTSDTNERVRREALRWEGRLGGADALSPIRHALENGTPGEKQVALASLGSLKGAAADEILTGWLTRAAKGEVPPELQLDLLEAGRGRESDAVKTAFARFEKSLAGTNAVLAQRYLLHGGDESEGRKIFFEKQDAQCARCHMVDGEGGIVGPQLADIGTRQSREYILESIIQPNATVAPGFENVTLILSDERELSGTVQKEAASELVLNTLEEGAVTVKKEQIRERLKGLSGMPEGLGEILTPRELRDLVEFLAGLKKVANGE